MTFEKIADINAVHFGFVLKDTTTQNISLYMKYKIETKKSCTIGTRLDSGTFTDTTQLDITGNISEITWTGKSAVKNINSLAFSSSNLNLGDKITVYSIYAVLGDTFEPIVPSPDYPAEIKTVGSNENIFDGLVSENNKRIATGTGGSYATSNYSISDYIEIESNTSYVINTSYDSYYAYYDSNKKYLTGSTFKNDVKSFSNISNVKYIRFDFKTDEKNSIKVEKGSVATPYSKYGQGCVTEVICNKNLFDIVGLAKNRNWTLPYTETKNGITITINKNGSITISGTATSNIQYYLFGSYGNTTEIDFNIPLEKNKTYISSGGASSWNTGCQFILYDYDGTKRRTFNFYNNTLTMDKERFKPTAFGIAIQSGTTVNQTYYLQIEENSEPTAYEEHKEQKYIIPTQQEMLEGDYFDWDNEEEVHTWNKLVLNGTEEFNSWTGNAPSGYKVFYLKSLTNAINHQGDLKCNTFKYMENPWESGKNAIGLQRVFKEVYISIESKYASTLEEFKAYLKSQYDAGTPVVVYYKLATPTRLAFTDEQKAVAKELKNAKTYDKITHIYSTDEISPNIEVTYKKNMEILFTNTLAESGV